MDTTGLKKVYDEDGTTRYVKDPNYKAPSKSKTKPTSGTKSSSKTSKMVAKGKPYKGQSSKKAVAKTKKAVVARGGKTGRSALKQARRMVRARKADASSNKKNVVKGYKKK